MRRAEELRCLKKTWDATSSCGASADLAAWASENDEPMIAGLMDHVVYALERLECRSGPGQNKGTPRRDALSVRHASNLVPVFPGFG